MSNPKPKRYKSPPGPGKKDGRPKHVIAEERWKLIIQQCQAQCTGEEIVSAYNAAYGESICYDTMEARVKEKYGISFSEFIKSHAATGKASLRRMQWKAANEGNGTMLVWLGKQYLGQRDKQDIEHSGLPTEIVIKDAKRSEE